MASTFRSNRAAVEKQIGFGVARGLTQVAKGAAETFTRELPEVFDRPTPFTLRAISTTPATRDNPVSKVFIKPDQARYLIVEETGGTRTPQPGAPVNVPVDAKLNQYGNIPRRAIKRYVLQDTTFVADGQGRTSHLKPGIYRRAKVGKRRSGETGARGNLELLVAFRPAATYTPRLGFRKNVTEIAKRTLGSVVEASIADALRTAK